MKRKIKLIIESIFILFMFSYCKNLSECNKNIVGRYYCYNDGKAINYIDINEDGTFIHCFKKSSVELKSTGTWSINKDGYCYIELSEWKDFNEKGENFKEFGNGILYSDGEYLNISPDGESSNSFKKKSK
ncbi:hypothetical protein [Flavobacterium adhaerens]|uniref:hypothetical protein n=1 Tax=Flavobacterium adhaerens TaxID=3149043 RepID=UPI0032B3C76F